MLEAFSRTDLNGKPIAGVGHNVSCPLCKGVFPIAEGSATYSVDGIAVALDGMKTACGAALIASGSKGAANVEPQHGSLKAEPVWIDIYC